jgi:hypothetical protein
MTCDEFRRLLDEQGPQRFAHCADCERDLRAAREVERMLATVVPATVSVDFDQRVFARIHRKTFWNACMQLLSEPLVPVSLALTLIALWRIEALVKLVEHITVAYAALLAPLLFAMSWLLFRALSVWTPPLPRRPRA